MKRKTKYIVLKKIIIISFFIVLLLSFFGILYIFNIITDAPIEFDKEKLIASTTNVCITDYNGVLLPNISPYGKPIIGLNKLKKYTINAFISIEDKEFYNHQGINIKRIVKALLTNIKSGYSKEGASTISQQTIKNSHLTNEKTYERKIKELYLTFQLEKTFTKEEIIEIYLNIIYFGNNNFGIEQASQSYFNKSAEKLTISESAMLAGLIKSPQKYSPINNYNNCILRRDFVLKEMLNDAFITKYEYDKAIKEDIVIDKNYQSRIYANAYERLAINEACKILNISEKNLINSNYIIQTYYDPKIQNIINNTLDNNKNLYNLNGQNIEHCILINDVKTGGLLGLKNLSDIDINKTKRQPASTLKPILVYAPALENGLISPCSYLNDEKISINNYSPHNSYNKYLGKIPATKALAISSNVCSVNLLNCIGINKAKNFASKFGIEFSENDNHLALALGAMEYGTSLNQLSSAYSTLANSGLYTKIITIKQILSKNGNVLYHHSLPSSQIISNESSFLLTKMLQECSKTGTNKKLSELKFTPASKTGTNGSPKLDKSNLDAYNISYNPTFCLNIWCGNTTGDNSKNLNNDYAGGNINAIIAKQIWQKIYSAEKTADFIKPDNIKQLDLDNIEYVENKRIVLASPNTPSRYIIQAYFNKKFAPNNYSTNFTLPSAPKLICEIDKENYILQFNTMPHLSYKIFQKDCDDNISIIAIIKNNKGIYKYQLQNAMKNISEYYVVAEYVNLENNEIINSEKSNIIKLYNKNQEKNLE